MIEDNKIYLFVGGSQNMRYNYIDRYLTFFNFHVQEIDHTIVNDVLSYYPVNIRIEKYVKDYVENINYTCYFFRYVELTHNEALNIIFGNIEKYEPKY